MKTKIHRTFLFFKSCPFIFWGFPLCIGVPRPNPKANILAILGPFGGKCQIVCFTKSHIFFIEHFCFSNRSSSYFGAFPYILGSPGPIPKPKHLPYLAVLGVNNKTNFDQVAKFFLRKFLFFKWSPFMFWGFPLCIRVPRPKPTAKILAILGRLGGKREEFFLAICH